MVDLSSPVGNGRGVSMFDLPSSGVPSPPTTDLSSSVGSVDVYFVQRADTEVENIDTTMFHLQVSLSIMRRLRLLKHQAQYSTVKRVTFAKLFHDLFKNSMNNITFMQKLAKELSFESFDELLHLATKI